MVPPEIRHKDLKIANPIRKIWVVECKNISALDSLNKQPKDIITKEDPTGGVRTPGNI